MAINHNKPQDQIPPIVAPQPDNITGNLNNNLKVQQLGANLFEGEALAGQEMAKRNLGKPVMPPSPDPMGDQYGMQFNQPFAQKKLKKIVNDYIHPVPQEPKMEFVKPTIEIPITRPAKRIYREPSERIYREIPIPREMTGLQVEQRIQKHEEKIEKPRNLVPQKIQRVNMEGPLVQTKYKMPLEGVQDLQDMGAVKEDKKGQYVVNENATSVSDTLRFPKGTKHYSGKPYKKGQLIDESDYEDIIKKVNKS